MSVSGRYGAARKSDPILRGSNTGVGRPISMGRLEGHELRCSSPAHGESGVEVTANSRLSAGRPVCAGGTSRAGASFESAASSSGLNPALGAVARRRRAMPRLGDTLQLLDHVDR